MKKILIALAIWGCLAGVTVAQNTLCVVSNVSTMIMPMRNLKFTTTYTNGQAVPQGGYLYVPPAARFWAVNNGTATNPGPTALSGDFTTNGIVWRSIPAAPRHGTTIINATTNVVNFSLNGEPAELGKGGVLSQKYSTFMIDHNVAQNAIYAICADPTATICIMEW